jgi:hypothetical protein
MGRIATVGLLLTVLLLGVAPAAAEPPTAAETLKALDFPSDAEKNVLAGEMLKTTLDSATERDLAVGLAFLVKLTPAQLQKQLSVDSLVNHVDPTTIAFGALEGDATAAALAALKLSDDEAKLYRSAAAGSDLNLSSKEIASLKEIASGGSADAVVRSQLLDRYHAYRSKGLAGIAPYQRDGSTSDPATDMRKALATAHGLEKHEPDFYRLLGSYPQGNKDNVKELFSWVQFNAHGNPTLALVHVLWLHDDDLVVAAHRQFYVNRGYNNEQSIAGFFPVKEGTLVVYVTHTSTDQVAGFGGGAKRGIGERVMASHLVALFDKVRKAAVHK